MRTRTRESTLHRPVPVRRMRDDIRRRLGAQARPRVNGLDQHPTAQNTIVVVGNGTVTRDQTALIDRARWVYRFNRLDNFGGNTGTRIDFWVLASHRVVLTQLAHTAATSEARTFREVCRAASSILFAVPCRFTPLSQSAGRRDLTERVAAASWFLQQIDSRAIPAALHTYDRSVLAHLDRALRSPEHPFPSNGYLTVASLMQHSAVHRCDIAIIGFNWKGWCGHPWDAEEQALRRFAANGDISIIE